MKYVVLGAGPTGLSAVRELLESGLEQSDVYLIDQNYLGMRVMNTSVDSNRVKSIHHVVSREARTKGIGKFGQALKETDEGNLKPSSIWGVSCLPPVNFEFPNTEISTQDLMAMYTKLCEEWEIQAQSSLESAFPISGETLDKLPRKKKSHELYVPNKVIHSRLAISVLKSKHSDGCKLNSDCFSGCPTNSPWNPDKYLKKLLDEYPNLNVIKASVRSLDIPLKVVHTSNGNVIFDFLYLSLGAIETKRIIESSFHPSLELQTTPVVLVPFLLSRKSSHQDYTNSFHYCDLLIPHIENNQLVALTQMYLPSQEITGRIVATFPSFLHRLLAQKLETPLSLLFRRLGICMIFLSPVALGSSKVNRSEVNTNVNFLSSLLGESRVWTLRFIKRYLLGGASHHVGSIHIQGEKQFGVNSEIFSKLAMENVYLVDTSALPSLPPGPHTSIAAALAKIIVKKSLKL
jgi:hypothetical protein